MMFLSFLKKKDSPIVNYRMEHRNYAVFKVEKNDFNKMFL
jgi:hypothetical protein